MQEFEFEIYEMFIDQIESEIYSTKENISLLQDKKYSSEAINNLFRTFHNYKATASYFKLTPLFHLTSKVEIVLNSLRETQQSVPNNIVVWLYQNVSQILVWLDEMVDYNTNLSPIPKKLNNKIKLSKSYISPKKKLKTLNILYFDNSKKRSLKMVSFLNKIVKSVTYMADIKNIDTIFQEKKYNIIITNLESDNHIVINHCKSKKSTIPIVAIFTKIDAKRSIALMKSGINHIIKNPLNAKIIQNELNLITNSYFSSINIIIDNETITNFIQIIKPLSNTLTQIIQICDDVDIPLNTLIKVIKKDPIVSAKILNLANSPLYGAITLKTIDQAIVRLGKNTIKALALKNLEKVSSKVDLTPYHISEYDFSKVSMKRLSLMLKWYSKISISDLSILSTTALLGNIGQILIAQEVLNSKQELIFQSLVDTFGIQYAEESTVFTTTAIVSSQLLSYWQLSRAVINIVMYSDNPEEAPKEIVKLAVANHIVFKLIPLDGKILEEVPEELLEIMHKYNFEIHILEKALHSINEVKF